MTDTTTIPAPKESTPWAQVANNALHYIAGGALLAGAGYLSTKGVVSNGDMTTLILAGGAALGWKFTR